MINYRTLCCTIKLTVYKTGAQNRIKVVLTLLSLYLISGCSSIPNYSIVANRHPLGPAAAVASDLENPEITGAVRVGDLSFETLDDGSLASCCIRIELNSSGENFYSGQTGVFVSVPRRPLLTRDGDSIYVYSIPPLHLPVDGSPIELRLVVEGETKAHGSVSLASDVIVLPVHVHIFTRPADRDRVRPELSLESVRNWFDPPTIRTEANSATVTEEMATRTETSIITKNYPSIYIPTDGVWNQAKIQFKMETYETISNEDLAQQVISGSETMLEVSEIHRTKMNTSGIHVYVGKNVRGYLSSGQTKGPNCSTAVNSINAIALAWDNAEEAPVTLAHELGHYLGLEHVDQTYYPECARELLDPSDDIFRNLMHSRSARTTELTTRQRTRGREMACLYLRTWEMPSPACG